jgi:hypothetical protein
MLRVERSSNGDVVFRLSGRMDQENVPDLKELLKSEAPGRPIVLDLRDVTLVNNDAVTFLRLCEADGITLKSCPAFIREWIKKQRGRN